MFAQWKIPVKKRMMYMHMLVPRNFGALNPFMIVANILTFGIFTKLVSAFSFKQRVSEYYLHILKDNFS